MTAASEATQPQPPAFLQEAWPCECNTDKAKQPKRDKVFLNTTHCVCAHACMCRVRMHACTLCGRMHACACVLVRSAGACACRHVRVCLRVCVRMHACSCAGACVRARVRAWSSPRVPGCMRVCARALICVVCMCMCILTRMRARESVSALMRECTCICI